MGQFSESNWDIKLWPSRKSSTSKKVSVFRKLCGFTDWCMQKMSKGNNPLPCVKPHGFQIMLVFPDVEYIIEILCVWARFTGLLLWWPNQKKEEEQLQSDTINLRPSYWVCLGVLFILMLNSYFMSVKNNALKLKKYHYCAPIMVAFSYPCYTLLPGPSVTG